MANGRSIDRLAQRVASGDIGAPGKAQGAGGSPADVGRDTVLRSAGGR